MKKFCALPFRRLEVMPDGTAYVCCPGWLPRPVGNVLIDGPRAAWGSVHARDARRGVLDGSFRRCVACPFLATSAGPVESLPDDADLSAFTQEAPAGPKYLNLAVDLACNLACPSCRRTPHRRATGEDARVRAVQAAALSEGVIEGLEWLSVSGSGDPFASAPHLDLLRSMSPEKTPNLKIRLHTNGTLCDAAAWERLGPARDMVRAVEVSVDAATPETYAANRGGDWDALAVNLEFLSGLRRAGRLEAFQLWFVTQANNWREAEAFLAMGVRLAADVVFFSAIRNWGTFGAEDFSARAAHLPGHPDYQALRALFSRPAFASPPALVGGLLDPHPVPDGVYPVRR